MVSPISQSDIQALQSIQWPESDLLAVIPYIIPLVLFGITLFFYQRHMPQDDLKRNLLVLLMLFCYFSAFILVLYAGFGSAGDWSLGSWSFFIIVVNFVTRNVFGSSIIGTVYIIAISIFAIFVAYRVITPPEPDFVSLREELKESREKAEFMREKAYQLEGENKQLKEFLSGKETTLSVLQEEIDALKKSFSEKEAMLMTQLQEATITAEPAAAESGPEEELLQTISRKDQTISELQNEIVQLKSLLETSGEEPVVEIETGDSKSILDDYTRRAETATEVADTVISDLAELMSMIDGSSMEPSAKSAVTDLVSGLGRAIGKVAGPPGEREVDVPKIEMIGAVMMVHEILDAVKRQIH